MFLEASETQRTAKRTLRYWLLLALRILLLVALVLAFAGPLLTERIVPRRERERATACDRARHVAVDAARRALAARAR